MSDSTIVEITDSSLKINKVDSILEETNKRKLSNDDNDEFEDSISGKKVCRDTTESLEDSSLIVEPTLTESINDESQIIDDNNDILEKNINDSKVSDEAENSNLNNEDQDSSVLLEDEKNDEILHQNESEDISIYDEESTDDDDDALMVKAMNALPKHSIKLPENDEPIALDSESEVCSETLEELNDEHIEEDDSLLSLRERMMRYNPKFYFARILVRKAIKVLLRRSNLKNEKQLTNIDENDGNHISTKVGGINENVLNQQKENLNTGVNDEKCVESFKIEIETDKNVQTKKEDMKDEKRDMNDSEKNTETSDDNGSTSIVLNINKENNDDSANKKSHPHDKTNVENSNNECNNLDEGNAIEIRSLLNEISSSTVDEIVSRYIIRNSDSNATIAVDDFSEQLFYCLQENKKEIENLQHIWNEKLHLKFKIREIMERLRRQRVISEIETFGIKPSQDNQHSNMVSSKSSTTNSTENEHYERSSKISAQSVNRLIQDVRENVLKKEKHRIDDIVSNINENFEDCSSFGLNSNMFQSSSSQGRQGQTIDVQSIINDFRQKNPQEIPRRGRRMKSSFPNSYLMSNQIQTQQYNKGDDKVNNAPLDHNTLKSNASVGFPEVSLLPVSSYYKTHSPQYGQKSSLLQSILTKQPNKNSLAMQPNNKSSTLARLLTAPEKSFQSPSRSILQQSSKVHNNGEITITPIAGTSRRQMIDDEENSEPPLVIDESDDFDLNDRHNTSGSDLLCQGCRRNKALFMCAGCSRQWYCSKECQELAWDDHAESCMV